ncbi:DUF262 domain-containing protein [Thalassomonas haliotis]|uniref:DUF262 domain-containing protein n=1 Tax=Thalassomonas haliotis TaxID=485448 RepID=A0ABY7VIE4_9GAMM|nr:DUF262 domain-containing protein [Thalassomonas haliotis]WDE13489.1 DUF262 domain-containing protein [Thalassomonas haliotis]
MHIKERNEKISSVYDDIVEKELDLKPDFQRGEVWSTSKKKLLIDSIFREWHVPPIHVVLLANGTAEVLDGQQRLTAISEFKENRFSIDGSIEPKDENIMGMHNKKYRDLDIDNKRIFDRFLLKIYEIRDYNQGEPSELFYRLNQTVKLTSAEARNSIYGDVREDIKALVDHMEKVEVDKKILGFSNSRMAYNDMLSRVCMYLEKGHLRATVNDSTLNERYRHEQEFSSQILTAVESALSFLGGMQSYISEHDITLNLTKASSLNWLVFISREHLNGKYSEEDADEFEEAFLNLELAKYAVKNNEKIDKDVVDFFEFDEAVLRELILIYIERSSSRVMSVGSIIIRDILLTLSCYRAGIEISLSSDDEELLKETIEDLEGDVDPKSSIEYIADQWQETFL